MLDIRTGATSLEVTLRDTVLYALGYRLPAVADVAGLRAIVTAGAATSQRKDTNLVNIEVADVVQKAFRWSSTSIDPDDGSDVIQPDDVTAAGRWLSWTSPLRFAPTQGGDSMYLHEVRQGPLRNVIVLDKYMEQAVLERLIFGQVPSVAISVSSDGPADMLQATGWKWDNRYRVTVEVVAQSLRDERQAAQDPDRGANAIDGWIWSLLAGSQLYAVENSIRNVQVGPASNSFSEGGQRRVVRTREYVIQATVIDPPAPNDFGPLDEIDVQPDMTDLDDQPAYSTTDMVTLGCDVVLPINGGLAADIEAGTALIGGTVVTYNGESGHLFSASKDTYRDLDSAGVFHFVEANVGDAPAAPAVGRLRVGVTRTDSSDVISDRYVAQIAIPYGDTYSYPLD